MPTTNAPGYVVRWTPKNNDESAPTAGMTSALDEMEYLSRSDHRIAVLDALYDGPRHRDEVRAALGASSSTFGRVLNELEDRYWVTRAGPKLEATQLGRFVADGAKDLLERLETERELRAAWRWLPSELDGFRIELVADAAVTVAEPGDPYGPANRCASFYRGSERLRGFDAGLTAPHHFEELYRRIVEGMATEIIFPPAVSRNVAETYPEQAAQVVSSESFTLYLHDDVPLYRVVIYDDRVGIGGYDPESGVLAAFLDTDDAEARAWAESTYESYRREAQPFVPDDSPS